MEKVNVTEAFIKFKPENCVFIISIDENKKPNGMICGWNMKCSIKPPLIGFCLSKKGYTHKLIKKSKEFSIAIPNEDLEEEVKFFGSKHGNIVDKFEETKIETFQGKYISSPLLKKATINFECILENEINAGDHILFIGKILASYIDRSKGILFNMKTINGERIYNEL